MFLNIVPNSDSEQFTESKLSRVHSAPTLGPGCARTAPRPRTQCALGTVSWPCRSARPAISWPCRCRHARTGGPCRSAVAFAPGHDTIFVSQPKYPAARTTRHVAAPCCAHMLSYRSAGALYRDPKSPPSSTIQIFVSRPTPGQTMCARATVLPASRPDVS